MATGPVESAAQLTRLPALRGAGPPRAGRHAQPVDRGEHAHLHKRERPPFFTQLFRSSALQLTIPRWVIAKAANAASRMGVRRGGGANARRGLNWGQIGVL